MQAEASVPEGMEPFSERSPDEKGGEWVRNQIPVTRTQEESETPADPVTIEGKRTLGWSKKLFCKMLVRKTKPRQPISTIFRGACINLKFPNFFIVRLCEIVR